MSICTCPIFDVENICANFAIAADLKLVAQSPMAVPNYDDEPLICTQIVSNIHDNLYFNSANTSFI